VDWTIVWTSENQCGWSNVKGSWSSVSAVSGHENGIFMGASACIIKGISHLATLEAMACTEALTRAEDLDFLKMVVSMDCLEVVNSMKTKNLCVCSSILYEIETRYRNFALVDLKHDSSTSNVDAHLVARNAIA
jgi:hypothetical protein